MSALCGTGIYANDVLCEVISELDELGATAEALKVQTLAALGNLETTSVDGVTTLANIDYDASGVVGIPVDFVAPTTDTTEPDFSTGGPTAPTPPTLSTAPTVGTAPTVPTAFAVEEATLGTEPTIPAGYVVPTADSMLIADAVFDDIFDRTAEKLARVAHKEERDAVYAASSMGIGLASASLLKRLERAQDGANVKISETALEAAVQEGVWKREDVKELHGLHVKNWPLKPGLDVELYKASEGNYLQSYQTYVNASVQNWPAHTRLETEVWSTQGDLDAKIYQTKESTATANYAAQVQGFTASTAWSLGFLKAETDRFEARINNLRADISSEAERRGWSEIQLKTELQMAEASTKYAIAKAAAILQTTQQAEQAIATLMAGLTQAVYSAASYGLSGSGSQSVSETI